MHEGRKRKIAISGVYSRKIFENEIFENDIFENDIFENDSVTGGVGGVKLRRCVTLDK